MAQATYMVQSRVNSTLQLAGIIDDYSTLDLLLRLNALSEWTLTIDRRSAHLPNLVPVSSPLGINGNGIIVTRDYGSGPQVILSGPVTHIDYNKKNQLATLKGFDDKIWLFWRSADTVPASYPYSTLMAAYTPLRYYRLGDTSGTTAVDSASGAHNGTYNGGFTLNQTGGIEDTDTAVLFNGTSGYMASSITTGLPTAANAPVTRIIWFTFPGNPAAAQFIHCIGNRHTGGAFLNLNLQTSGAVQASTGSVSVNSLAALSPGIWHCAMIVFDGSKLYLYVDGVLQNSGGTSASLTLAYSGTAPYTIASQTSGSGGEVPASFFGGTTDEDVLIGSALTADDALRIYQVGRSRNAYAASDNRSGTASTVMIAYVNNNAGPGTLVKRQVSNLTMAADPSVGGQVTGVAREDNLLTLLQNLALQSGDNIKFDVQQTLNTGSNTMAFSCAAPADKTSNAIFSDEIGNLADYSYSVDWPTMNVALVGDGSNTGAARNFLEVPDSGSVSTYGRVEGFVQGSASTDYQTMLNAGQAQLLQTKAATSLSITPVDTTGLMYQRDYNLGDKVTVYLEGQTIQDKVREVHIQLTKGSGAGSPDELVTPAIGQPNVAQAVTSMLSWLSNTVNKRLQAASGRLNQLERNR